MALKFDVGNNQWREAYALQQRIKSQQEMGQNIGEGIGEGVGLLTDYLRTHKGKVGKAYQKHLAGGGTEPFEMFALKERDKIKKGKKQTKAIEEFWTENLGEDWKDEYGVKNKKKFDPFGAQWDTPKKKKVIGDVDEEGWAMVEDQKMEDLFPGQEKKPGLLGRIQRLLPGGQSGYTNVQPVIPQINTSVTPETNNTLSHIPYGQYQGAPYSRELPNQSMPSPLINPNLDDGFYNID